MLRAYNDIKDRIKDPILWYDRNGVPRYDAFCPEMCNVYAQYVAYIEIGCQRCGLRFMVSSEIDFFEKQAAGFCLPIPPPQGDQKKVEEVIETLDDEHISAWERVASFHYGDPPSHDCVGDTMNSVPLRIVEFWERASPGTWKRNSKFEFEFLDKDKDDE